MTFQELYLAIAIERAGRCSDTPKTSRERRQLANRVLLEWVDLTGDSLFPFDIDAIVAMDTRLRKSKNTRTKTEVAQAHGANCFWQNRNKGTCCKEVECGHLWQASKGGPLSVANCVIECRSHNNQRSDLTVEQYIQSPKTLPRIPEA